MKFLKTGVFLGIVLLLFTIVPSLAQTCKNADECKKLISEYESKLSSLGEQKRSLSSQIQFMDTQIYLTQLRIQQTEQDIITTQNEIENLAGKIDGLNTSLDYLSHLLVRKIAESYKRREIPFLNIFVDAENAAELSNRLKYARITQENDRRVAFQVQQAKSNFEQQRTLREQKKIELADLEAKLGVQKADLDSQKGQKQRLLTQTQSDERTYQNLLAAARSEFAAIQGIVAGAGTETELRDVKKGDSIASVIGGASCNSSGTHLHFIVQEGGGVSNPFNYLKPVDHSDDSGGDPWTPSGSWDWPISPSIQFYQGYGETWAVRNTWVGSIYRFHNGIDIGGGNNVQAVADGKLFRGSYSVGCALSYAKLVHKDSNITTLYLHVYVN